MKTVGWILILLLGADMIVLGIEKTGQFVAHFDELDWCDQRGPRGRFDAGSAFLLNDAYVKRNIILRDEHSKPHGEDTYFGRKVLYKTTASDHAVVNIAMLNDRATDFANATFDCYPRLGDILTIFDHLSTYLYQDGFMPLVRAHAAWALGELGELGRAGSVPALAVAATGDADPAVREEARLALERMGERSAGE